MAEEQKSVNYISKERSAYANERSLECDGNSESVADVGKDSSIKGQSVAG